FEAAVERCMCTMQTGTQMIKLRGKSKTLVRFFYLDEHRSCIRWRPSRKHEKAKSDIKNMNKNRSKKFSNFDANCCFSIYHGCHVESLDLVTTNGEEARTWITGLKYLLAGISDEDSLARRQRTRDQYPLLSDMQDKHHAKLSMSTFLGSFSSYDMLTLTSCSTWLRQTFSEADKNGDGNLSIGEVLQLLHKLNVNLPRQKVRELFEEADTDDHQGCLAFEEFCNFYKIISTRCDLYLLMLTYSHRKEHMDIHDLLRFLESEQKMVTISREYCQMIITQFEPCPRNRAQNVLGIDGFTNYMRSPAGDIFNPEHNQVNQDMTQPLTNYYIASSHNTYLTGDQLLSQSRVDMYAYVLQAGCRCVEVDCWDGPDGEPIVHHGYTLTSKILFRDVVETINKYAFAKSQYPVIISIENHCSVPQQKKMAQYLTEVLKDKLDLSNININEFRRLPSPETLRGKILVKGKKLPANIDEDAEEGDVSDEDSGEEEDEEEDEQTNEEVIHEFNKQVKLKKRPVLSDSDTDQESSGGNPNKTMRLSRALSDLVKYTKSVRVHDIETQAHASSWQVSSLNESISNQILQFKPGQLVRFNQRQLLRVYPSNYRVDSSNFNPQPFWNAGCHLVALNYQTEGRMLQLNRAKFAANGNCGYVLKPKCMCKGAFNPVLSDPLPGHRKTQLVLKIISGQQLPKPKDSMLGDRGEIIDPYVEVEIIGLPVDCNKEQTRVVDDNGFNPMWEETLVFTLHMPKIALVRFMVWDHDPIGRDFIGQRTIAFTSIMPGYRHVYLEGSEEASIFVHVAINDITGKAGLTQIFSYCLAGWCCAWWWMDIADGPVTQYYHNTYNGFDPNQANLRHQENAVLNFTDLPPLAQQEDTGSDSADSPGAEITIPAPQRPDRPSLSKQFSITENVSPGPELECRKYKPVSGQALDSYSRGRAFKDLRVGRSFEYQTITAQESEICTDIWTPKSPGNNLGNLIEKTPFKFDPKLDRFPKQQSERFTPTSQRLTGKSEFGLKGSVDLPAKPSNQSLSIPATPAMGRRVPQSRGGSSSTESQVKLRRSSSVPRRRPTNSLHELRTDFL
uniref:Phosphoinositide phospholipase C n=1 Tax=Astyanax mexicanus TaxID=7994 RepID=A0A8B9HEE1_ASTMX